MRRALWWTWLSVAASLTAAQARADDEAVRSFYAAHQMKMIIRSGPGGTYDFFSRLLSQYMSVHLPAHPTIVNINMPGAGGISASNYVGLQAPRDGTVMTIVGLGLPLLQALGVTDSLKADLRTLKWIGSVSNSNEVLVTWRASHVQNLEDARKTESLIGTTGVGSVSQQLPSFYNHMLGTKFKLVFGYQTSGDVNLAMQRGEVEGSGSNEWSEYLLNSSNWVHDKTIIPIIQTGLQKEPDLPDTPLLLDLAKTPRERAAFLMMSQSIAVGRALATTPDIPPERLAALRKAFDDAVVDPDFIAAVAKGRGLLRPVSAEIVEHMVQTLLDAPQQVRDDVRTAQAP